MDTPPSNEICKGSSTTADKIRALASAGYDRAAIAEHLGIRCQQVRNVLVRSGIAGGLRRKIEVEREPIEVDAKLAPREDTSWKVLIDAGFTFLGEWIQNADGFLRLSAGAPSESGVYAFVVDDVVVYVGVTLSGLKTRFDQYRLGNKGQKTSSRARFCSVRRYKLRQVALSR